MCVCVCVCVHYDGVSEKHLCLRGGALHADDRASKSVSKHVLRPRRHKFVRFDRSLTISRFYLHVCRRVHPCMRRLYMNYAFRFIVYTESSPYELGGQYSGVARGVESLFLLKWRVLVHFQWY